jgi:hypothetical protein
MSEESPFVNALCDAIESNLPYPIPPENVKENLLKVLDNCRKNSKNLFAKVVSVAYYRKFIKFYIEEIKYIFEHPEYEM